ncbi:HAMP domain-containing histidine kinase [Nonomuraea sp. K274]|uniref:histidine kinase n=1 Tax=Nonomuraea cypriaca TaxID=1187855 RepID=A0A931AA30_9ACTN|nr:HAMP domain-containing sensor histidine kinase [Nonomuraea cypriaca]MBF8189147.1 HAMP domain-containing histidine kinase [Nonomuraea cypriaca]
MITRLGSSMRARLTLFAGVAMALLCLVISTLLLGVLRDAVVGLRTEEMLNSALRMVHLIRERELPMTLATEVRGIQVVDATGSVRSSTPSLAGSPRLSTTVPGSQDVHRTDIVCDLPQFGGDCQIAVALRVYQPEGNWYVYIFEDLPPWYVRPEALAILTGASVALAALTSFVVSRVVARTLAPVDRITAELAEITAGDPRRRVPVPENADEIKALAQTANQTLERLGAALEQQRRFASDASHDLRSPLTAMRAELEAALLAPGEVDWCQTGDKLLTSLDRLQNIVTDLLTLARLDAGAPTPPVPVDLGELVACETSRPRSKKTVTMSQPRVFVKGHPLMLARLLTNLLDNAERHAESRITVTVRGDGEAVLEVLDDGAGIAPEHRESVFDRFTRLDAARRRDAGGTGLGLPIAREIARIHHGTLTIEDSDKGARFVLRMPVQD